MRTLFNKRRVQLVCQRVLCFSSIRLFMLEDTDIYTYLEYKLDISSVELDPGFCPGPILCDGECV